ncbi:AraC-type DNA-binding protein [Kushneria avicenniae]|uniref:AraC-type DNA-binding protein n=1 Tax=Kushneria avicenniae TaxID=402385 RepID=A0A1I1LMA7_9GAMM|nr:AraC family transcriptional regulator [Kushneria avicenniae]SFC74169.1 AraC-type DNA-binding protein [Kushneria avicenniae]
MTISQRHTVAHFLGYGYRYSIDYRFPRIPASQHAAHTPIANGRVEEIELTSGVDLFISDLDVQQPYQSISKGATSLLVVVMLEGCAHFDTHDQQRWITAGEACCIRLDAGLTLSAFHPAHQRLRILYLSLNAAAIQAWYGTHSPAAALHIWALSPGLKFALEEVVASPEKGDIQRLSLHGLALQVIAQGMARPAARPGEQETSHYQRLELVRHLLDDEPTHDHSLHDLAKRAAMSPSTLHRHFKATYGLTPIDYLRQCRLVMARELLSRGQSVQQAAHGCGYRHASNFITAFKKVYGVSPGALAESSPPTVD